METAFAFPVFIAFVFAGLELSGTVFQLQGQFDAANRAARIAVTANDLATAKVLIKDDLSKNFVIPYKVKSVSFCVVDPSQPTDGTLPKPELPVTVFIKTPVQFFNIGFIPGLKNLSVRALAFHQDSSGNPQVAPTDTPIPTSSDCTPV